MPHPWLQARIAMIYKSAPPEAARSYRPISVATGMYSILARLILDTLRGPIDAALSDPQAGCRRGYTTSQQALRMSMLLHQYWDGALVCLLDIAKAYPSMPHECLTYGLQLIGTPARIYNMVASIYAHSTGVYGDVRFPLRRGIKEGCPLSPALFVLVYEAFHQTLTREFPNSTILAYVDDIAIISPSQREMQHVLERASQLSAILGLKTNPSKTQVYLWAPPSRRQGVARRESPTRDTITWGDARLPLQPPIFHYLGHLVAHPTWEQKARDDFVGTAAADLARYQYLPLNAFERVQLLSTILIPRWTYRTLFLPNDSMFKAMDSMCLRFVLMAEGMELNKVDVHKSYNVLHVTSPHRLGGMGLHQLFWAHRARFTTMVQNTLRSRPGSIGCNLSKELPSRAVPTRNYLAILTQLGARTALHIALPPRPAGGPNLIDSESSDDGVLLSARKEQVGDALHTRHYIAPHRYHEDPSAGTVPAGYHPVNIAGIPCYSNKQPPTGTSLYSDGSLQTVQIAGSEYQAAGAAVTKGPLRILASVAGPQQSYRAEMYGAAIGAAIASDGDTQYIDNMAVTKCAHRRPTHECSDADIRHKVCDQVQHKRVAAEWIPSHRLETEARNAQEREQIRRNGEVDLLAKMATRLPLPDYDPQRPKDIAMCGGPAPTPARKWILQRRRVVTFDGAHWVSWLPMRGDRRMLWVKWLSGQVRWEGTGAPWDHTNPKCPICPLHHGTTVHKRLIHCMRWKVAFRNMWLSTWGPWQDTVTEWWNRASTADLHHVSCLRIPQSLWDRIPRTMRVDLRERVAWHQYHALHGVCQLRGQLTMPPRDPQVPPTPSTAVPAWYTKLRSRAVRPNPTDSILRNQVGYTGPRERTQRQDGRTSQETSHRRAARTWDRPQSYYTRSWAEKYLDQCLCPTAADPGAQHVASAMQYLAQPWFLHQRAVLGASLMVSYRDMLEDLVRQSRHWHTLLRRARVWTTSADQHYQRHDRRVQLFSLMSQLWASERAAH